MHLPGRACGGQRAILGNQFSPSTEWVSGIKLKSSGLAAGAFTHRAFGPSYVLYMHLIFHLSLYSVREQQANSRQYDVYCLVNLILGLTSMLLVRLVHTLSRSSRLPSVLGICSSSPPALPTSVLSHKQDNKCHSLAKRWVSG